MTRRFRFDGEAESFVNQPGDDTAVGLVAPGGVVEVENYRSPLSKGLEAHGQFTEVDASGNVKRRKKKDEEEGPGDEESVEPVAEAASPDESAADAA